MQVIREKNDVSWLVCIIEASASIFGDTQSFVSSYSISYTRYKDLFRRCILFLPFFLFPLSILLFPYFLFLIP